MEQVTLPEPSTYQVFINHRGPDTKKNIASLIYHRLTSCHGLRVFLDQDELHTGMTVQSAIKSAIDSSSVHIALFSKRYAESRSCLDELCWMMQRSSHQRKIIPVFCDVEPHHLRGTDRSPYADAFAKHQRSFGAEVVEGWKNALRQAAKISGLPFKTEESDHGKFLEQIVKDVLEAIKWDLLDVGTYPVGLDEAAKDFQNKIMSQSELNATKVVIWGMGGLGKSTLARHLYNVRRSDFSRSCYLYCREKDLSFLQQKLVRDLLGYDVKYTSEGKTILRDSLRSSKILVVFDDVDDKEKIISLLDMDAVKPGSLILITCRDKDILKGFSANTFLYNVKPLKSKHAQELFCRYAFRQPRPLQGYETLVVQFLEICGGLPLCLKVLGEHLAANHEIAYWQEKLENYFRQGRPLLETEAVINTLKVSYEALNTEEKSIFLDVGCFLVGEDRELAVRVLAGLGWLNARVALDGLYTKCFLDFSTESDDPNPYIHPIPNVLSKGCSKIIMHEQVRELARHIARNDLTSPLRVSCSYDIHQILQVQRPSIPCYIRGICIPKGQKPPDPLTIKITGVRLLVVDHPNDFSSFLGSSIRSSDYMWGDLVWLRLSSSSLRSINPSTITISLPNLRVLKLEGSVSDLEYFLERVVKEVYLEHLQEFHIQCSEETFPPSRTLRLSRTAGMFIGSRASDMLRIIRLSKDLNKIDFQNQGHMEFFLSNSFDFTNLRHLNLSGCTNLKKLPKSFCKCLRLQYLALRNCQNLSFGEDFLGEISTLEYVDLFGCSKLVELPKGMAYQRSLRCLDLGSTNLSRLPDNLELLNQLEELKIGSPVLTEVPHSVAHLIGLKQLILLECPSLRHISTSIKRLTKLERLMINNWGVQSSLMQVEGLPSSLVNLTLMNCSKLKALTNLSNLVNLKILNIINCEELGAVNAKGLIQLEEIQASSCLKLQRIGALTELERLNFLKLQIYNENGDICDDIVQLLTSRSQISTFMVHAITDAHKIEFQKVVRHILNNFGNLTVLEVPATTTIESPVRLENLHSYGAILMCFIPYRNRFRIRFEAGNSPGKYLECGSKNGTELGMLDIFMWTEDSKLFNQKIFYNNVSVYCPSHGRGEDSDMGWIVPLSRKTVGLEVLKQFLLALMVFGRPREGTS